MNLLRFGDPDAVRLTRKAKNVGVAACYLKETISDMFAVMYLHKGIGLAGPQVDLPFRIIVMDIEKRQYVLINPKLVKVDTVSSPMNEGCLSITGMQGRVVRPERCIVDYTDEHGAKQRLRADGLLARCVQHELDHLDGILYPFRAEETWPVQ